MMSPLAPQVTTSHTCHRCISFYITFFAVAIELSFVPNMEIQNRILVVVKSSAMAVRADIVSRIIACEYEVIQMKNVILTPEQVTEFQGTYFQSPFYPDEVLELANRLLCAMFVAAPVTLGNCDSHANRLRNVLLEEFKGGVIVSDDCDRQLRFFFGDWTVPVVSVKPTIEEVNQFLGEHIHPVLMAAIQQTIGGNIQGGDDCVVCLVKNIIEVEKRKDPDNGSRWLKYDDTFAKIEAMKLEVRRRNYAESKANKY